MSKNLQQSLRAIFYLYIYAISMGKILTELVYKVFFFVLLL